MFYFRLESAVVLDVSGKDAIRYLHARLSNDIKSLGPQQACLAAALTPQGRTQAFFEIAHLEPSHFMLISDQGPRENTIAVLKQYLVADRVEVKDFSDTGIVYHVAGDESEFKKLPQLFEGLFPEDVLQTLTQSQSRSAAKISNQLAIARKRSPYQGIDFFIPQGEVLHFEQKLMDSGFQQLDSRRQELYRILGAIPAFPHELNEQTLFSESGMSDAISFTKGCYVGQEVIEKVDARGKVPRVLKRLVVPGLTEGTEDRKIQLLENGNKREIGIVTSIVQDRENSRALCFAYLKNIEGIESMKFEFCGKAAEVFK